MRTIWRNMMTWITYVSSIFCQMFGFAIYSPRENEQLLILHYQHVFGSCHKEGISLCDILVLWCCRKDIPVSFFAICCWILCLTEESNFISQKRVQDFIILPSSEDFSCSQVAVINVHVSSAPNTLICVCCELWVQLSLASCELWALH